MGKSKTLAKIRTVLLFIVTMLEFILPLVGVIIADVYQIQVQYTVFGYYDYTKHIWGWYDLWNLTLFGYIIPIIAFII